MPRGQNEVKLPKDFDDAPGWAQVMYAVLLNVEDCTEENTRALKGFDGEVGLVARVKKLEDEVASMKRWTYGIALTIVTALITAALKFVIGV